jgi:hypothetical protein
MRVTAGQGLGELAQFRRARRKMHQHPGEAPQGHEKQQGDQGFHAFPLCWAWRQILAAAGPA